MIFFLLLGIALGAISVMFILQNTELVTVTFLAWQLEGSLALILFLAVASGIAITLLILLPSFIIDLFSLRSLRKQNKALQDEVAYLKDKDVVVEIPAAEPAAPVRAI
jgi:uncharacterized integral membrane protein